MIMIIRMHAHPQHTHIHTQTHTHTHAHTYMHKFKHQKTLGTYIRTYSYHEINLVQTVTINVYDSDGCVILQYCFVLLECPSVQR